MVEVEGLGGIDEEAEAEEGGEEDGRAGGRGGVSPPLPGHGNWSPCECVCGP